MARYRKTEDGWVKTGGGVSEAELDVIRDDVSGVRQDLTQLENHINYSELSNSLVVKIPTYGSFEDVVITEEGYYQMKCSANSGIIQMHLKNANGVILYNMRITASSDSSELFSQPLYLKRGTYSLFMVGTTREFLRLS